MSPCCHGSVRNTGELLSTRQKGTVSTAFPPLLRSSHTHGFITLITILSTCFGRSSPVLSEREKEKCAGSLLFFEGCTGFNSQIIIYSLIFVTLPDSCAHCKKIGLILLIYLHQLLSNLFCFPFSLSIPWSLLCFAIEKVFIPLDNVQWCYFSLEICRIPLTGSRNLTTVWKCHILGLHIIGFPQFCIPNISHACCNNTCANSKVKMLKLNQITALLETPPIQNQA